MAAANRLMGKLVDKAFSALGSVKGVTPYQGKVRLPDNTNLESLVKNLTAETECYAIVWMGNCGKKPVDVGRCLLHCLVFFNLPKNTTSDCNSMYDKVDEIISLLAKDTTWSGNGTTVEEIYAEREDDELQDSVAVWRIDINLIIPAAC